MSLQSRILLPLAAAMLWHSAPAMAADYEPPVYVESGPEYVPVEVGSGWYLRGDVGFAFNKPFKNFETPAGFTSNQTPVLANIGMGYHFNDYLRGELNFGILPSNSFANEYVSSCDGTLTVSNTDGSGNTTVHSGRQTRDCPGSDNAKNKGYSGMANAYFDLGTFAGFTPYVGGGLGVAYVSHRVAEGDRHCRNQTTSVPNGTGGSTTSVFECDDSDAYKGKVDSERRYNLAYSLGAGLSYRFSPNGSVDVGYEYFSVPNAQFVSYDSTGPRLSKGLDFHQVKLGLRYDLW
jgi:opacity protein-like surface antigen